MTEPASRPSGGPIVRTFWHGPPLDPCRLLCLRSFVAQGISIKLFAYDPDLALPDWIVRRDADEIWPTDQVLRYRIGEGQGSPALHANLFRLALLQRLGGWWVDADVILLRPDLPDGEYFFSREDDPYLNNAIMKVPAGHALLAEAIDYCRAVGETAIWGQTGPRLLTELVRKHGLTPHVRPGETTCPVQWWDVEAFFDPRRHDEVRERSADSVFLHLCMEMWRRHGVPNNLAPPEGSFLGDLVAHLDLGDRFCGRMDFDLIRERFGYTMRAELMRRLAALEMTLEERNERLLSVERTLDERTQRILSLEATLAERDHRLKTLERANGGGESVGRISEA